jgi:hypothetical protein
MPKDIGGAMTLRDYVRGLCDPEAPLNVPRRLRHDEPSCSAGKDSCLTITRTERGWKYFCHRCGEGGFIDLKGLSTRLTGLFARGTLQGGYRRSSLLAGPIGAQRKVELPKDFTTEIPADGLVWLYRYGLTRTEIKHFKLGYSPSWHRVILPVYDKDAALIYWQGRYLGDYRKDKTTKYINQWNASRERIYFFNEAHSIEKGIVLVEDILSAIKVGRVVNSVALLFATIPRLLISNLVGQGYLKIWLWLDSDKAEYTARALIRLRNFNYPVRRVYSPKDPKCYTESSIKTFLKLKE